MSLVLYKKASPHYPFIHITGFNNSDYDVNTATYKLRRVFVFMLIILLVKRTATDNIQRVSNDM